MNPVRKIAGSAVVLASLATLAGARPCRATQYDVPDDYATLQEAVTAAEGSVQQDNFININAPVITTNAVVTIDDTFGPLLRLTIRPGPGSGLARATIASSNGSEPIFSFDDAGYVTLADLDIVRNATNNDHLILMDYLATGNNHITIERCRIGSIWTTPGSAGWSYLSISRPTEILVRNCIFFSYAPGNFYRGIDVSNFADPANSIRLYNNVVADTKQFGIAIADAFAGTFVVLRNNVVSNEPTLVPEPFAYRSNVAAGVTVVTSHNAAFATGGMMDMNVGVQSIVTPGLGSFVLRPRAAVDDAFAERVWDLTPPWDPNGDFFRLAVGGPLHGGPGELGQMVGAGAPHPLDQAVLDDVEKDARPTGSPLHTDRGADQIERGTSAQTGLEPGPSAPSRLWMAPFQNPARDVAVLFRAPERGVLAFEVLDLSGRRLYASERAVAEGESGTLAWSGAQASGIYAYRARLTSPGGVSSQAAGRIVVVR